MIIPDKTILTDNTAMSIVIKSICNNDSKNIVQKAVIPAIKKTLFILIIILYIILLPKSSNMKALLTHIIFYDIIITGGSNMKKILANIICFMILISMSGCTVIKKDLSPAIWMGPNNMYNMLKYDTSEYEQTFSQIDDFHFFIGNIAPSSNPDIEQMQQVAKILNNYDFDLSLETGGIYNHDWGDNCGQQSAAVDIAAIHNWYANGGRKITNIFMDEPIGRVTTPLGAGWGSGDHYFSYEKAGEELADYLTAMYAEFGEMNFYIGSNFPHWGWKSKPACLGSKENPLGRGDWYEALTTVLDVLKRRNVKIAGLIIDNPYDYTWKSDGSDYILTLFDVERFAHENNLKFNLIINTEAEGTAFEEYTLLYLEEYLARGGRPDSFIVESWYVWGPDFGPEILTSSRQVSITATTLKVINYCKDFFQINIK